MVRLKDGISAIKIGFTNKFQFQYGAIKSLSFLKDNIFDFEFQFQYGAIKSVFQSQFIDTNNKFQFQYGAIKRT